MRLWHRLAAALLAAAALLGPLPGGGAGVLAPEAACALEAPAPLPLAFLPLVERFLASIEEAAEATGVRASSSADVTVTFSIAAPQPPAVLLAIFRFYSPVSGTHFYTPDAAERDMVMRRWPEIWQFEGIAYHVNPARNVQPLYRFYNRKNGSHFYTASAAERDMVFAKWMNVFQYDGPTYAVTPNEESGKIPVYRFYNLKNGSHFYTASTTERDNVIRTWPHIYRLEGPAFWLGQ